MIDNKLVSLPARGAWIERPVERIAADDCVCRSPQGGRGLKAPGTVVDIEGIGRSPQGGRGLKDVEVEYYEAFRCRSPQGGRGLKDACEIVIVKRKLGHLIGRKLVHPDWAEDDSINVNH